MTMRPTLGRLGSWSVSYTHLTILKLVLAEDDAVHAVCLTFKNISKVTLTALEIHFK